MLRTLLCTLAATGTLGVINVRQIVFHGNGTCFTLLRTNHAADTARLAGSLDILALILGAAAHEGSGCIRNQLNQMLRTFCHALTAGYTLFSVYHGNAVNDVNRIKLAGSHTASEAETSIFTKLITLSRNVD